MNAKIAQLVEHDLAKVGVAGSSPVFRSTKSPQTVAFLDFKNERPGSVQDNSATRKKKLKKNNIK